MCPVANDLSSSLVFHTLWSPYVLETCLLLWLAGIICGISFTSTRWHTHPASGWAARGHQERQGNCNAFVWTAVELWLGNVVTQVVVASGEFAWSHSIDLDPVYQVFRGTSASGPGYWSWNRRFFVRQRGHTSCWRVSNGCCERRILGQRFGGETTPNSAIWFETGKVKGRWGNIPSIFQKSKSWSITPWTGMVFSGTTGFCFTASLAGHGWPWHRTTRWFDMI